VYALRGLRQAALMVVGCGCVALVAATLWSVVWNGEFRPALGISLMVIAALISFTGSDILSRATGASERAMMGLAPEREDRSTGSALAPVGVFLFVCVPVFVIGGVVYGTG
jgi:hypothetical protein